MSRVTIHRSVAVLLISILAPSPVVKSAPPAAAPSPGAAGISPLQRVRHGPPAGHAARGLRVSLTVSPRVARAGTRMWARGAALPRWPASWCRSATPPGVRTTAASWVSIGASCTDPSGGFARTCTPEGGQLVFARTHQRCVQQARRHPSPATDGGDSPTTGSVDNEDRHPNNQDGAILNRHRHLPDLGAQDIAEALQSARVRFRANHPKVPTIRIMVNAQWVSAEREHPAYLLRLMNLLGVSPRPAAPPTAWLPSTGRRITTTSPIRRP